MDCLQISYSDIPPCWPSNGTRPAVIPCENEPEKDGCQSCMCTTETCGISTGDHGPGRWIASQRDFLARIFHRLAEERESKAREAALSRRYSEQLTLFDLASCGSKTAHESEQGEGTSLLPSSWRVDTPGATDDLPLLIPELRTSAKDGGALLPTLTVCGNWNRKGASPNSGDGLATALKRLPTLTASDLDGGRCVPEGTTITGMTPDGKKKQIGLPNALRMLPTVCATDYKSPYSAEGYNRQRQHRSKPLRDTLVHTTGHRLTPAFAEWWMGWPLRWTATRSAKESKPPETDKCQSRQRRRG